MLANVLQIHFPIMLVVGAALVAGGLGAKLFQKLRVIPQVVGYILIGLALGETGLGVIDNPSLSKMKLFNTFALGVIGFMIGGELKLDVFRKYGKQFILILLAEGIAAFVLAGALVFLVTWWVSGSVILGVALGLVLGAIASATAPAATVDVLWENKTRGPLTTAVFAIVAMDDGLALLLYGIAASIAGNLVGTSGSGGGMLASMGHVAYELFGAVGLGAASGLLLNWILKANHDYDKAMIFILGMMLLVIGGAHAAGMDVILATMALGMTVANLTPFRSKETFGIVERLAPPIYVLFFVIVGSRLRLGDMCGWMWWLASAFVVGRTAGKLLGSWLGARWARAASSVRKYLGMCLFSQAGVAIGLAIDASEKLNGGTTINGMELGNLVLMTVTATTFLVQIVGPACVRVAVHKAGEVGMNITRDDLLDQWNVSDVMQADPAALTPAASFREITQMLGEQDTMVFPVLGEGDRLDGMITMQDLRAALGQSPGMWNLLVAFDLMQPPSHTVAAETPLKEALQTMEDMQLDSLPVLRGDALVGMLDLRRTQRKLQQEIFRRQEQVADREQADLLREQIKAEKAKRARA
ncbi:MAG: CBS domain-containing protein [Phycisphaerales bacterium]|jgi:Kef-type K+ transport system membrane component KefB|nr:CBS domain-containing protein [Phycisphaerales bacterium]MBT7171495.1 CBS domain-containing protein [Phycisphaerales bacterium]